MGWFVPLPKWLQMSQDVIFQTNIKIEVMQTMTNNNAKGTVTVLGIDLENKASNSTELMKMVR